MKPSELIPSDQWTMEQLGVLTQIHAALTGKKSGERRRLLVQWGVNDELWPLIQSWFDQEGNALTPKEQI